MPTVQNEILEFSEPPFTRAPLFFSSENKSVPERMVPSRLVPVADSRVNCSFGTFVFQVILFLYDRTTPRENHQLDIQRSAQKASLRGGRQLQFWNRWPWLSVVNAHILDRKGVDALTVTTPKIIRKINFFQTAHPPIAGQSRYWWVRDLEKVRFSYDFRCCYCQSIHTFSIENMSIYNW